MFERFIRLAKAKKALAAGRFEDAIQLTEDPWIARDRRADAGGIAHGDLTKTVAELRGTVRRRMKNRRAESGKLPGELDIGVD